MKALKKENEAIQKVVQETLDLLKQAHDKLDEVYDGEGVMQLYNLDAAQCVIHAACAIQAAAAWLNSEHGENQDCVMLFTPRDYAETFTFEF